MRQAEIDESVRHAGLTTEEAEEVRQLREERESPVKAAAFSAKEMEQTRP